MIESRLCDRGGSETAVAPVLEVGPVHANGVGGRFAVVPVERDEVFPAAFDGSLGLDLNAWHGGWGLAVTARASDGRYAWRHLNVGRRGAGLKVRAKSLLTIHRAACVGEGT